MGGIKIHGGSKEKFSVETPMFVELGRTIQKRRVFIKQDNIFHLGKGHLK
jgi:hypothetical protein